jgi:exopolysaccharide biosynthesis protein
MNHQYYCKWFYSDKDIADVYSRNYIQEVEESTDSSLVDTDIEEPEETVVYENEYEQAILERDPGTLYKIIRFEVNGCNAYLAVIYDPSKVSVTTTNKIGTSGQYVTTMAKREKAVLAINGGGFYDPGYNSSGGKPRGITIVNGKIVTNNEYKSVTTGGIIGITNENKLVLLKNTTASEALEMGVRDAVSWGPFLIVNGKAAYTEGNGGWGYAARTAIGQRADGIMLLLVVDSNERRSKGANMVDLTQIMQNYGAINAANLDGGTSSVMVENGELINDPIDSELKHQTRPIATAFIVTE